MFFSFICVFSRVLSLFYYSFFYFSCFQIYLLCFFFSTLSPSGYSGEVTPVPISNTVVKLSCADGTWCSRARETMAPLGFCEKLCLQLCKQSFSFDSTDYSLSKPNNVASLIFNVFVISNNIFIEIENDRIMFGDSICDM